MTEWGTVVVIVTLFGLIASVVKPVISLTKSITTLTVMVDGLKTELDKFCSKNSESHERIWTHEKEQDGRLDDHEKRIIRIEGK